MCYNSNSNKDKDVVRIKKGMVFWWNPKPEVFKESVPNKEVLGRYYPDRQMYGRRPWVVVSGNENNRGYLTLTVCPLSSKAETSAPYHIEVNMLDGKSVVCIEQMIFVNEYELVDYYCTLTEPVIKKIDEKIAKYFGISNQSWSGVGIKEALDRIEVVLDGMVNNKLEESKKFTESDIEYLVKGVLTKLESKKKESVSVKENTPVKSEEHSIVVPKNVNMENPQVKKFYQKYPDYMPKPEQDNKPMSSITKREWTVEMIHEFLSDCESMNKAKVKEKWQLASEKAVYSMRYFVKKKLEKLSGK